MYNLGSSLDWRSSGSLAMGGSSRTDEEHCEKKNSQIDRRVEGEPQEAAVRNDEKRRLIAILTRCVLQSLNKARQIQELRPKDIQQNFQQLTQDTNDMIDNLGGVEAHELLGLNASGALLSRNLETQNIDADIYRQTPEKQFVSKCKKNVNLNFTMITTSDFIIKRRFGSGNLVGQIRNQSSIIGQGTTAEEQRNFTTRTSWLGVWPTSNITSDVRRMESKKNQHPK